MSTRLVRSASRRAVLAATPRLHALLDVLAPAALPSYTRNQTQLLSTSATPCAPTASSSRVRLDSSTPRQGGPSRARKGPRDGQAHTFRQTQAPDRSPRLKQRPSPSRTLRRSTAPSASDLLSEIRRTPSSTLETSSTSQYRKTVDAALYNVSQGLLGKRRDFTRAFLRGWLPLRQTGQAARISPEDLGKLVQAAAKVTKDHAGDEGTLWRWGDVRELLLYAAGERDTRPVADWAWKSLELGWVGAERVEEVFDAIWAGEHRALRAAEDAPNAAYAPPSAEFATAKPDAATVDDNKPSVQLFAASVVARALLRSRAPPAAREPIAVLLAQWTDARAPLLQTLIARGTAATLLERHVPPAAYSSAPLPDLAAALRQTTLAQTYYARRGAPGVQLLALAREMFRTGRAADAWELWGDVVAAVEGEEAWMGTARWGESGAERRLPGERGVVREGEETGDGDASAEVDLAAAEQAAQLPALAAEDAPLPPAMLHQAVISSFIAGFVQARATEHANAIWSWLLTRAPPLVPGVVCWTGLLHGYAVRGEVQAVEAAFADLQRTGPAPDVWAWMARVDAHFVARLPDDAMRVAREMMRDRAVLCAPGDAPLPEEAWNRLTVGLLSNGRRVEAESLLGEMRAAGVPPSIHTVNGFLRNYTRGAKPDLAAVVRVLKLISEHDLEANVYTYTMVLQTLLAGGLKDATKRTIAIMEQARVQPTATTYGAIVHDLVQSGKREHLDAAVQLLDEMEAKRIPANEIIYTSLIQGFLRAIPFAPTGSAPAPSAAAGIDADAQAQHPYMVAALTLKERMEKRGLRLNRVGYNAFLSAALALQSEWGTEFALRLFGDMQRERVALARGAATDGAAAADLGTREAPGTVADTWYILLDGFVRMGDFGRAHAVVQEMQRQGFEVRNRGLQRLVNQVLRGHP